jgi:S1-C subfamily serine protease
MARSDEADEEELPTYMRFMPCIVGLETTDNTGSVSMGTAFHIGDGYLVTARHVVEDRTVTSTVLRSSSLSIESIEPIFPDNPTVDLALLRTDFSLSWYMNNVQIRLGEHNARKIDHIQIGSHLDDWIDDGLVLMNVVSFGFPPIPTSSGPALVAVRGEVNAIIDPYTGSPHPLFIISPLARGGFSGGPVLTDDGWLIGTMTSSLVTNYGPAELGFGAALTVEPLWHLLFDHHIFPASNARMMYELRHAFGLHKSDFPFSNEVLSQWESESINGPAECEQCGS